MMAIKMEQGYSRLASRRSCLANHCLPYADRDTLITAAGFLPIATAASSTGEYTRSIFQVVTIALLVSWFAAVLFVPYLGDKLLPDFNNVMHKKRRGISVFGRVCANKPEPQPVRTARR